MDSDASDTQWPGRDLAPLRGASKVRFGYAVRAGRVVHVSEVARGRECGCRCARCGEELLAKKGELRQHHFAHLGDSSCDGGVETLLHRLAKEIISWESRIRLPAYHFTVHLDLPQGPPFVRTHLVSPEGFAHYEDCDIERPLGQIIPDLILVQAERRLIIEIAVSHRVDRAKLRALRKVNLPAIEIRLKREDIQLDRAALRKKLIESRENKSWLFHPAQRQPELEGLRAYRNALREARRLADHERKNMANLLRATPEPPPATSTHAPQRSATSAPKAQEWQEENNWAEAFYHRRGRYPSLSETLAHIAAGTTRRS